MLNCIVSDWLALLSLSRSEITQGESEQDVEPTVLTGARLAF